MNEKKQFTFEDWRNGVINKDYQDGKISLSKKCAPDKIPEVLHAESFITNKEFKKIENAQREAFFKAVKVTVENLTADFLAKLKQAPEPEKLLEAKISLLESKINDAPKHYLENVYEGRWSPVGIDFFKYLLITYPDYLVEHNVIRSKPRIIHLSNPSAIPDENQRERSMNFFARVTYTTIKGIFPKLDIEEKPEGIEPFKIENFIDNHTYDLTVTWRYLKNLRKHELGSSNSVKISSEYPDPIQVAKLFIDNSPNTLSKYSLEEYSFVMKYARDEHMQSNISQLIRDIKSDKDCPALIKQNEDGKAIRRWIKFYDNKAGIKRR